MEWKIVKFLKIIDDQFQTGKNIKPDRAQNILDLRMHDPNGCLYSMMLFKKGRSHIEFILKFTILIINLVSLFFTGFTRNRRPGSSALGRNPSSFA